MLPDRVGRLLIFLLAGHLTFVVGQIIAVVELQVLQICYWNLTLILLCLLDLSEDYGHVFLGLEELNHLKAVKFKWTYTALKCVNCVVGVDFCDNLYVDIADHNTALGNAVTTARLFALNFEGRILQCTPCFDLNSKKNLAQS